MKRINIVEYVEKYIEENKKEENMEDVMRSKRIC